MKTFVLLSGLLALSCTCITASPCLPGSLQSYTNLAATGCDAGNLHFSNFAPESGFSGATFIDPAQVLITPSAGIGLLFTLNAQSAANQVLESFFRFSVSAPGLIESSIQLDPGAVTGDGAITGILNTCAGTYAGVLTGCSGTEQVAIAFRTAADSMLTDTSRFSATSFFDVFADLTADGGLTGSAGLSSALYRAAVPEPSAGLLVLSGTTLLIALRVRRIF